MGEGGGCCPPMDLFRSEAMHLVQVIIPIDAARLTVSYLGDIGLIQFKDLNADKSPFQRTYAGQIKRCAELARKLRFFKDQMSKAGVKPSAKSDAKADFKLDDVEVTLGDLEAELTEINANSDKLQRGYNELVEYKLVLQKAGEFFKAAQSIAAAQHSEASSQQAAEESLETPLLKDQDITDQSKQVKLGFLTGLVPKGRALAFERILFRATRGNVFLRQSSVDEAVIDPTSGEKVEKNVFVVFFSGERAKSKILKICEAFGANRYPYAEDLGKQAQMITEVSGRLSELKTTIDAGLLHRGNLLETIGKQYEQWSDLVRKEKSIYHTLNMLSFDVTKKCLVAEGWSPVFATQQIKDSLQKATVDSKSQVGAIFQVLHTKEMPPTYFQTNKFTESFQTIVDAYGVAKYQEANPGVYTVVTFPFLFAVMFGDWGHGICILLACLFLISREKKYANQKLGDIMEMTFGGRYVILLMSLFSIYTGLIYNEFFSVPFELFSPSAYVCRDAGCSEATTIGLIKARDTYPFGVDPAWHGSRSELPSLVFTMSKTHSHMAVTIFSTSLVVIFAILGLLAPQAEAAPRAFFVFGDSLVDSGNNNYLVTTARADAPPYGIDHPTHRATGRFSNGLNIPDLISQKLGSEPTLPYLSPELTGQKLLVGANFASAGIGILNDTGVQFVNIIRAPQQLDYFKQYQDRVSALIGPQKTKQLVNNALVLMTLGGNDFVNNYYLVPMSARSRQYSLQDYVPFIISEYKKILMRVYDLGARKVLVTGTGPLGCVPAELAQHSRSGECAGELQQAAALYNPQLDDMLNSLNNELGSHVFVGVNTRKMHNDFMSDPKAYGFVTGQVACCGQGPYNGMGLCTAMSNLCSNREQYAFWDAFHPTEKANKLIVEQIMAGSTEYMKPMNLSTILALDRF